MTDLDTRAEMVLAHFRKGKDTLQIARLMQITEAQASHLLWLARCWERGLPATYLNRARQVCQVAPKVEKAA
jgi:hypothetical protein